MVVLLAMVACGCAGSGETPRQFLGDHAAAILKQPQGAEVFRVTSARAPTTAGEAPTTTATTQRIGNLLVLAQAPRQDAAFARSVARIFLAPQTYDFGFAKGCLFQPDYLIRVHGTGGWVDLVTCYHCREFRVSSYDADGKIVREPAVEDFVDPNDRLAALLERATGMRPYHE